MKTQIILEPNYDVSGGDTFFEGQVFSGTKFLEVQLFYSSLSQADSKLRLQECLDGVNYIDSVDSSNSPIEITIDNTLTTDIVKVNEYNTAKFRFRFVEGTAGTGTIDKLMILME